MELTMGDKNEIRDLYYRGKYNEAIKRLAKLYNMNYNFIDDKFFIFYNLALYNMKFEKTKDIPDFKIANYYLNEAYNAFEPIKDEKESEYKKIVWLDTEINKNTLPKNILLKKYKELHEYFKKIECKTCEIGILINIYRLEEIYDDILNLIYDILDSNDSDIEEMLNQLLQECKSFGDTYYEKALKIIKNTKVGNCTII